MAPQRAFHVVIWGASGFTGRLVCEHLARDYQGQVRWAMAGRSRAKLEAVRSELAAQYGEAVQRVPILLGDTADAASLDAIAAQTAVVLSMAGPYSLHGTPVVEAAVRCKTHYVDITGEVSWVRTLLDRGLHEAAAASGTRLVPCCGYDSIPFDCGAYLVASHLKQRYGKQTAKVMGVVLNAKGGVSGGTVATGMQIAKCKGPDSEMHEVYTLVPRQARGPARGFWGVQWSNELQKWLSPFFMQETNMRVVHRSNFLLKYGESFQYQEAVVSNSWLAAKLSQLGTLAGALMMSQTWLHPLLRRFVPAPGEGPSRELMLGGHYHHAVVGWSQEAPGVEPTVVRAEVGDPHRDPGYWGTSRMALEAALCLALQLKEPDKAPGLQKGGLLTPASALGELLLERLRRAGITYSVVEN